MSRFSSKSAISAAILAVLCPAASYASDTVRYEDFRAVASPQVFSIMASGSSSQLNEDQARQIAAIIMEDGRLDEAEIDLIDEIISDSVRAITIRPSSGDAEKVVGSQSGAAKRVFLALMEDHYQGLYEAPDPAKGWEALVRQSLISSSAYKRVQYFLAPKALAAGKESTVENTYKPIREYISALFARHNQLPDETQLQDRSRWLIYSSVSLADMNMSDQLPDFLYSWARPQPAQ